MSEKVFIAVCAFISGTVSTIAANSLIDNKWLICAACAIEFIGILAFCFISAQTRAKTSPNRKERQSRR